MEVQVKVQVCRCTHLSLRILEPNSTLTSHWCRGLEQHFTFSPLLILHTSSTPYILPSSSSYPHLVLQLVGKLPLWFLRPPCTALGRGHLGEGRVSR